VTHLTNGLIFQLAKEDQNRLQDICEPVALTAGQVLGPSGPSDNAKVYFLTGACVALLVENQQHHTLAVGLVGTEGVVGLGSVLDSGPENWLCRVQTSGSAWAVDSHDLTLLLHQRPGMLWVISQYLWQLAGDVADMSASVQFDDITTRLARWLALSAERAGSSHLQLTHEHLAQMLGVRRVSITLAAVALKDQGLIRYQRGTLDILDLPGLRQWPQAHNTRPQENSMPFKK
jgi:CRP-like cAMP-binding protein